MMMLSLSHDSGSVIINPDDFNLCATGSIVTIIIALQNIGILKGD